MDAGDITDAIDRFNDPKADVDAMVAAMNFATGLNLHGACSEILMMEVSLSPAVDRPPSPLPG